MVFPLLLKEHTGEDVMKFISDITIVRILFCIIVFCYIYYLSVSNWKIMV